MHPGPLWVDRDEPEFLRHQCHNFGHAPHFAVGPVKRPEKGALTHMSCRRVDGSRLRPSEILPCPAAFISARWSQPSLVVDHIKIRLRLTIAARPAAVSSRCPRGDGASSRVHSRYTRALSDLPVAGRRVVITTSVRRFRSVAEGCRTKIFAERLEPGLAAAYARRTGLLDRIVHHLGLALGGRPAEGFARRGMVPASRDAAADRASPRAEARSPP